MILFKQLFTKEESTLSSKQCEKKMKWVGKSKIDNSLNSSIVNVVPAGDSFFY